MDGILKMANYRFFIQYEGTRYQGWQKLGGKEQTIQGKLEEVLARMTAEEVTLIGSGRTDAGVHAKMQVANAHFTTTLSEQEIMDYVNRYLPEDIAVTNVTRVAETFHSRFDALEKTYLYRVRVSAVRDVFNRRYIYDCQKPASAFDLSQMRKAAGFLVGTHDFQAFCGRKIKKKSTVRTIMSVDIKEEGGELQFLYRGNGFLFHMVRILTGTLLEVGEGRKKPEAMEEILRSGKRQNAGETVPAKGLTLLSVKYPEMDNHQAVKKIGEYQGIK